MDGLSEPGLVDPGDGLTLPFPPPEPFAPPEFPVSPFEPAPLPLPAFPGPFADPPGLVEFELSLLLFDNPGTGGGFDVGSGA